MTDTLVQVDNISKKFCRSLKRSLWYGMKDLADELAGSRHDEHGQLRSDEFWAVRGVSFELRRGECLGLVGHNGAGKTTLLRMLNGLIKPDQGRIEMRGRVGALIALGAGFNPVLSGRENIYVAGAIFGMTTQEIDAKYQAIVEFAELAEFIDAPVQSYSSGMAMRLGFSVAAKLEPDILILDEVMAVGDAKFQAKCANAIKDFTNRNSAVILVSHNEHNIMRYCSAALCLEKGAPFAYGEVGDVLNAYRSLDGSMRAGEPRIEGYVGKVEIESIHFLGPDNKPVDSISWQSRFVVALSLKALAPLDRVMVELVINDSQGLLFRELYGPIEVGLANGSTCRVDLMYDRLMLSSGLLTVGVAVWDGRQSEILGTNRNNCLQVDNQQAQPGRVMLSPPEITVLDGP